MVASPSMPTVSRVINTIMLSVTTRANPRREADMREMDMREMDMREMGLMGWI